MRYVPARRSIKVRGIALLLVLAFCVIPLSSCEKDPYRKAAVNAARIASLISSMTAIKNSLEQAGTISTDETLALTRALLKANNAATAFNDRAQQLMKATQPDTPANRTEIKSLFNEVMSALVELTNSGVSPIKNPDAKNKLLDTLSQIQSSVLVILELKDLFA